MSEPVLLYGVGAAKAGTSWFYRALHGHPDCALPAVKEAHYWDTFEPGARDRQLGVFRRQLGEFRAAAAQARAEGGRDWLAANMERRVQAMEGLIAVLAGDRSGDRAYLDWLARGPGGQGLAGRRLVADMTPAYALLPAATLGRMAATSTRALFVYLVRDPLSRLWSHVRMQAGRQLQAGETLARKANGILWRILHRGHETHVLARGDYPATHARLSAALPAGRLRVEYCERLFTEAGQRDMAEFLGIGYHPADGAQPAHEGPRVAMRDDLAAQAVRFLADHYAWAARTLGPLPRAWQDNLALASRYGA